MVYWFVDFKIVEVLGVVCMIFLYYFLIVFFVVGIVFLGMMGVVLVIVLFGDKFGSIEDDICVVLMV